MDEQTVLDWFNKLKDYWSTGNISGVRTLLAETFEYFENPNEPPLTIWEEVEAAWQEINEQHNIELHIEPLLIKDGQGTMGYKLKYSDSNGVVHESSGAYYVKLNSKGRALEFRQWWVSK